jgi:baseplate J-like protein
MSIDGTQASCTCGCCEPQTAPTPHATYNRPGLSSIRYRVGTYGSFLEAMTEHIAHAPELRERWLTRSTDDFDIALLAMWAYVADILTFYQERMANEAYLRTALLEESVTALAALLDYKPAPGSAAEADLAFFLEQTKKLTIPIGLRVQSVPGQNEKPQKFETSESILADATFNQIQVFPQPTVYQPFARGSSQGILLSDPKGLAPRIKLAVFNALRAELKAMTGLSVRNTQQVLGWTPTIQSSDFDTFVTQAAVYANEYRLFGFNAPSSYVQTFPDSNAPGGVGFTLVTASSYDTSHLAPPPKNRLALDAHYKDLKAGGQVLVALAGSTADPSDSFARLATVINVSAEPAVYGPLQDTVTWLTLGLAVSASPVAAVDGGGLLNAFVIGDDRALWTIAQVNNDGTWGQWQSLGGQIDLLAVGTNQDGRLEVFARGADKALWHIWQTSPGSSSWSSWSWLGGQIDMLAVGSNQDGRLEVFARGIADHALWHIWQVAPSSFWSGWYSLGGQIDLMAVGSNQDGRLEVFARGTDRGLWHIWQTAPNSGWSAWYSLGGQIDLLSVGSNQDGRLEVFVRGTDLAVWHIWQTAPNGGWSGWDSLGGQIDLLSVNVNQDGRLEVFARGTDQGLWHIWQLAPNNGWGTWASLGGQIDMLFAARNQDGRLEVFARGTDQALWHVWQIFPNGAWNSTWANRGLPMWRISGDSRGRITVYDVSRLLQFSPFKYGDSINGNTVFVPLAAFAAMDVKRSIILDDAVGNPQTVITQSVQPFDTNADGVADHWKLSFTPDLARSLSTASATLYGNVCASTHGQTIAKEVIGDGNAADTFQSFRLQKSPVTFVHQAGAPHGVADTLKIQIGGVFWKEVQDFYGHQPTDRIFMTSQDAKGMIVQFGDGVTGRRLPTGRGNVVATYRQGIGLSGNVSRGALRTLLDRPVGLRSVSNPAAAGGGADPESISQTRDNAPNTVRTFGRIVSLEDFEDAAREFAGVAKAHASWAWSGEEQVVYLTVAGDNGALITGKTYDELFADLNARRDPNRSLRIRTYTAISVKVSALVFVSDDHVTDDVIAAVQTAVAEYFSFSNRQFGQPVHLSNVYGVIQGVDGVTGADITTLQFKYPADAVSHGASSDLVQVHLRIDAAELAQLELPDSDVVIVAGQTQS